jgi:hypothetical protein
MEVDYGGSDQDEEEEEEEVVAVCNCKVNRNHACLGPRAHIWRRLGHSVEFVEGRLVFRKGRRRIRDPVHKYPIWLTHPCVGTNPCDDPPRRRITGLSAWWATVVMR